MTNTSPRDQKALLWNAKPRAPRPPTPSEPLFEFLRATDGVPMSCVLRNHGEPFGWEALFLERGEFSFSHAAFVGREDAVAWATGERRLMEG